MAFSRAMWINNKRTGQHFDNALSRQLHKCKVQRSLKQQAHRERWIQKQRHGGKVRGRRSWFKVTIPHGNKYDKQWLLNALQGECSLPFTPVKYHTQGHTVHFFIEDPDTAIALSEASHKITGAEGDKLTMRIKPCLPPSFIRTELKPEDVECLKRCMSKRFENSKQALNLKSIGTDPDIVSKNIEMFLNKKSCMQAVIRVIKENVPVLKILDLSRNQLCHLDGVQELLSNVPNVKALNLSHNGLKTEKELDKLRGFNLEEIWLDGNPLCARFKDGNSYTSAIRERFPQLINLDGHILPPPKNIDTYASASLPVHREEMKNLILRFLGDYYRIYDSDNRQPLLDAYHEISSFCLRSHLPGLNSSTSGLGDSRRARCNFSKVRDPTAQCHILKHTRANVVALLKELPKTQHDVPSFSIHVNGYTNASLTFTVNGVFKEVDTKPQDCFKSFSRLFVAIPAGSGGLCVVKDELFVQKAAEEQIRGAFRATAPPHSNGPACTMSATQQKMLSAFCLQSGMKEEWSKKCLEDNEWDFYRAAYVFMQLKATGKIPHVAFIK